MSPWQSLSSSVYFLVCVVESFLSKSFCVHLKSSPEWLSIKTTHGERPRNFSHNSTNSILQHLERNLSKIRDLQKKILIKKIHRVSVSPGGSILPRHYNTVVGVVLHECGCSPRVHHSRWWFRTRKSSGVGIGMKDLLENGREFSGQETEETRCYEKQKSITCVTCRETSHRFLD
jgi:hypothetical protein